jgi:hypothetical protein
MTALEEVAHRMFIRNVADYAEPALAELAWIDPDIRGFWVQQAHDVMTDLADVNDSSDSGTSSHDARVSSGQPTAPVHIDPAAQPRRRQSSHSSPASP